MPTLACYLILDTLLCLPPGSSDERVIVNKALAFSERPDVLQLLLSTRDLEMEVKLPSEIVFGSKINIGMIVTNKSSQSRRVQGFITPTACYYTGVVAKRLERIPVSLTVKADSSKTLGLVSS